MANIKVSVDKPISDGTKLKFRTPCESTEVEGLVVTAPIKNGVGNAVKTFSFVDANGNDLSGLGNVFVSDVMIAVILDVTKGRAFIQNADNNSYIEDLRVTVKRMEAERQAIFANAGKSIEECKDATEKANAATDKLKLSAKEISENGFVSSLKEENEGDLFRFWVGSEYEYEEQKDTIKENTLCVTTDDDVVVKRQVVYHGEAVGAGTWTDCATAQKVPAIDYLVATIPSSGSIKRKIMFSSWYSKGIPEDIYFYASASGILYEIVISTTYNAGSTHYNQFKFSAFDENGTAVGGATVTKIDVFYCDDDYDAIGRAL